MERINKYKNLIYIVVVILLILVHGLFDSYFKIDNITLVLLVILFVIPYFPLIRKIKFGDFEAEITRQEIEEVKDKVKDLKEENKSDYIKNLEELAEVDLQLALAKIRIEIEKQLRSLYQIYIPNKDILLRPAGISIMLNTLLQKEVIEDNLAAALKDIIDIANRAIHGEEISIENKKIFISTALKALSQLDDVILDHALKNAKVEKVNKTTVSEYSNANYLLTTIIPYAEKPEKRIYKLNQAELDAFLENYSEYAEFIVDLKKLKA